MQRLWFLLLAAAAGWPQFRGPEGRGFSEGEAGPVRWSKSENVKWKVEVPGRGWSSPIVWRDRVFVTSAISGAKFKEPSTGIYGNDYFAELTKQGLSPEEALRRLRARDIEASDEVESEVRWMIYALDRATGRVVWEREVYRGKPYGGRHRKNTYASAPNNTKESEPCP